MTREDEMGLVTPVSRWKEKWAEQGGQRPPGKAPGGFCTCTPDSESEDRLPGAGS